VYRGFVARSRIAPGVIEMVILNVLLPHLSAGVDDADSIEGLPSLTQ